MIAEKKFRSGAVLSRGRRHMTQLAMVLSFIWIWAAYMLEIAPRSWLLDLAEKIAPVRQLAISQIVESRVLQGADPLVYVVYCYSVMPIYLTCFFLVAAAYRLPPLLKIPEVQGGAISFYRRRLVIFAIACLTMMGISLHLPHYFSTQDQTRHVTILAIFDMIETWCQGIFLGGCISSIKEYKNERNG